jgi:voltage-gated potassium channel
VKGHRPRKYRRLRHTATVDERRHSWESRAEWPLTAAALAFIVAFAWPILDPNIAPSKHRVADWIVWATWAVFVIDFVVRVVLAERRWPFVGRHIPELVVIALPVLRPLRLLRLVTLLGIVQRGAASSLRNRVITYTAGGTALIIFCASLAELDAERHGHDATIKTFGAALWWSFSTITTVGYGDYSPVTATGRLVAVSLMVCGIALLGVVTASIATWLIDQISDSERKADISLSEQIAELQTQVALLSDQIERDVGGRTAG